MIEASLLRVLGERAVVGAMLSSGSAIEMLAGVRFRLSPAHRLDLLADAGFTHLSLSESYMAPTVGARAGLAWARRGSGRYRYVTVGVAVRHRVPDRTVPLYCDSPAVPCGTVALGGTLVGAFVTWSLHVGDST